MKMLVKFTVYALFFAVLAVPVDASPLLSKLVLSSGPADVPEIIVAKFYGQRTTPAIRKNRSKYSICVNASHDFMLSRLVAEVDRLYARGYTVNQIEIGSEFVDEYYELTKPVKEVQPSTELKMWPDPDYNK